MLDSLTHADDRLAATDVIVAGSFAGTLAFRFVLERGVRAVIAHAAGVGKDGAGISGLPFADRFGVPAAAVETMSARLGDGPSVFGDGVVAHVNEAARRLGVVPGTPVTEAARRLLSAPPGRPVSEARIARGQRVIVETPEGRIVLVESIGFAEPANARDVLCAGSHGGRVNVVRLLAIRPRGAILNDGGMGRDRSGVSGLPALAEVGIAAAAVDAMSARIGDSASTYETGVVSTVNATAQARGVRIGQPARAAATLMLGGR